MLDYSGWAIRDLYRRIKELDVAEDKIRVEKIAVIREIEARRAQGGQSPDRYGHNLASEVGMAPKRARELAELTGGLESLPEISKGVASGEISVDVASQIVKFATPEEDGKLAEEASNWSLAQAQAIAKKRREISESDARALHESRSFRWYYDKDKRHVNFRILLPTPEAESLISKIETELTRADRARGQAIDRDPNRYSPSPATSSPSSSPAAAAATSCGDSVIGEGLRQEPDSAGSCPRPRKVREQYEKRCADALIELIDAADTAFLSHGPRAQVVMVVSAGELSGSGNGAIEIGRGFGSIEVARRLCCDSDLEVVITDTNGRPKVIGTNSRTVPPKLSRLIRARDKRCAFPGCGEDRHIQVHHIVHFSKGGPTIEDNLIAMCYFHHHLVHEGGWAMTGSASRGLLIKSPYGQRYRTKPLTFELQRAS